MDDTASAHVRHAQEQLTHEHANLYHWQAILLLLHMSRKIATIAKLQGDTLVGVMLGHTIAGKYVRVLELRHQRRFIFKHFSTIVINRRQTSVRSHRQNFCSFHCAKLTTGIDNPLEYFTEATASKPAIPLHINREAPRRATRGCNLGKVHTASHRDTQ